MVFHTANVIKCYPDMLSADSLAFQHKHKRYFWMPVSWSPLKNWDVLVKCRTYKLYYIVLDQLCVRSGFYFCGVISQFICS